AALARATDPKVTYLCTPCHIRALDDRVHLVDGLLGALAQLDAVGEIFDEADNRSQAVEELCHRFGYSEVQANHIANMTLTGRTAVSRRALHEERDALAAQRAALDASE